ncbi:hypothetical protein CSW58_07495, partial [Caulobacter sp. B11]
GNDVLESLGLEQGVVRATKTDKGKMVSADGNGPVYGLQLNAELSLLDEVGRKNTASVITKALSAVRSAYRELSDLANGVTSDSTKSSGKTGGTVPTYLTNQISNYQAALNRLTGG